MTLTPGQPTLQGPDGLNARRASSPEPTATGRPRAALPEVGSTGDRFQANATRSAFPADLLTEVAERLGTESAAALGNINEGNRDELPAVVDKITAEQAENFWNVNGTSARISVVLTLVKVASQLPPEHCGDRLAVIAGRFPGATPVDALLEASQKLSAPQREKVFDTMLAKLQSDPSSRPALSKAVWAHPHERPFDEILKIIRSFDNLDSRHDHAHIPLRKLVYDMPMSKLGSDERMALVTELARQGKHIDPTDWVGKAWQQVCDANDPELRRKSLPPLLTLIGERVYHFDEGSIESKSPLKSMAAHLGELPETELRPAWWQMKEILRSRPDAITGTTPVQQRMAAGTMEAVLAGLMETAPRLAPEMQGEAAALIKGRWPASGPALVKLASAIPKLTEEAREKAFEVAVSCLEEAEKKLRHSLAGPGPSRAAFAQMGGLEGLLVPLSRAAGALPSVDARAIAVDQVLKLVPEVDDPASGAEMLKALAQALPDVLENPITGAAKKKHITRDALLQSFAEQAKALPPEHRVPALKEMLRDTDASASKSTKFFSRDKTSRLPALLRELLAD